MTDLQLKPGGNELVVADQSGLLYRFNNSADTKSPEIYLDITDRVSFSGEMGLLGFVFHPLYNITGYVFVDYTTDDPRRTVISRFTEVSGVLDPSTEHIILEVNQPYANHNAGQIMFGQDGYLYITLGDGGLANDPHGNGQDRTTLLGSILRIDVSDYLGTYSIPEDNPFVGNSEGWREEIFAYGLRNPWRMSQDLETGTIWVADVGQGDYEEVDILISGGNYGWAIKEGNNCFEDNNCGDSKYDYLIDPVHVYSHDLGISITGGFVYRGSEFADLYGKYVYGDFGSGRIWALEEQNGTYVNALLADLTIAIASFGVDTDGVLYILSRSDDTIYRLVRISDK